jgi:hypothetical protein
LIVCVKSLAALPDCQRPYVRAGLNASNVQRVAQAFAAVM